MKYMSNRTLWILLDFQKHWIVKKEKQYGDHLNNWKIQMSGLWFYFCDS